MQNFLNKKNLIIGAVVLILLLAAIIWYFSTSQAPAGGGGRGFFASLFPSGGQRPLTEAERKRLEETRPGGLPPAGGGARQSISQKLVSENISGATFVKNKVRYIERETGHVFDIDPDGQNKARVSNTTIPGIFEVLWSPDASRAVLKYLSSGDLNILSARFTASSTQGVFLSPDIKDIAFSPRGDRIAYVLDSGTGSSIVTATPDNKNQRLVAKSPFLNWRIYWPEENNLYLANAPSAFADGFLYRINLASGTFEKILGPRLGLEISTNGRELAFSESDRDHETILSSFLNLGTRKIRPASPKIVPEKCLWSKLDKSSLFCALPVPLPPAIYPDDWYQGRVSFSDILVKINLSDLSAKSFDLANPPAGGVDAVSPFLSEDERRFFYQNRRDGSLWKTDLKP